jgi:predicted Zn-dependent peptidase
MSVRLTGLVTVLAVSLGLAAPPRKLQVPITYYKLPNGLKVVLSKDASSPLVTVGVYYNIGFRIEPRDRTGFAHLFEHMMFQGSTNLGKMEFIRLVEGNGGVLNGSTRFDFTNYFEVVPSHTLETMLWAEGDRMRGLDITDANLKNQQGVVSNEVKVNVLNAPYGGFPWLDLPQHANQNWYNAHNFYGELKDIEAATLDDVKVFFHTYYAPNNASLVVVGDFDEPQARAWIEKYFGDIPAAKLPAKPDLTEPPQTKQIWFSRVDPKAQRPALAVGYHVPPRLTPEHAAMVMLNEILGGGRDSLLYEELVRKRGFTDSVDTSINPLGDAYNYNGPMLWSANFIHDPVNKPETLLGAIDGVMTRLQKEPLPQETLDRALVKIRAARYRAYGQFGGFGKADTLATLALFDDDPGLINRIEDNLAKVTPALIQKVARDWLKPENRTVLVLEAGAAAPAKGGE